ncbi:MAG: heme-binding protein [Hydrogenovibrio sp.]|uniref:GlcG/HbpS family heme-binding protein n=1 Tax=Hydrogenovibrio sp. TaxID=2065821 RepID=UPI0028709F16|nr:heme-binding protein [Hydrogenovibrio sp.]MDR9498486.1 heme-binding protein [Hydrogenovibrio sp.]
MKTLSRLFVPAALAMAVALPAKAEDMAISQSVLTLSAAQKVAQGAVDACSEMGIPVTATVVDRNGLPQAQLRDTMAPQVSWEISRNKAYTAVQFGANGSDLEGRSNSPLQSQELGVAFMAGSVLIQAGGKNYGAVGVSGAPDGMDDEKCAAAGVEAIQMDLEMM